MTIQAKVRTTTLVRIGMITRNTMMLCQRALGTRADPGDRIAEKEAHQRRLHAEQQRFEQDRVVERVGEELDVVGEGPRPHRRLAVKRQDDEDAERRDEKSDEQRRQRQRQRGFCRLSQSRLYDLDLAIEALDQRAALRIELHPVEAADLGQVVLGLGERLGDRRLRATLWSSSESRHMAA